MYKILVTTSKQGYAGQGCSIHTLVIEYNSIPDAQNAAKIINKQEISERIYSQTALLLF